VFGGRGRPASRQTGGYAAAIDGDGGALGTLLTQLALTFAKMQMDPHKMEQTENPKLLIVDDRVENLIALEKTLAELEVQFLRATSGDAALACLLEQEVALILLDVQMPGMDGFETAELIRSNKDTQHIPIIFVTAISKESTHLFKGYAAGAVDYLYKPIEPAILIAKVRVFLDLFSQKRIIADHNAQLKAANHQILEQQKSLIEEERLKLLLQMAGATAHELNQPLMSLLGNIELIRLKDDAPAHWRKRLDRIEADGQQLVDIVKKMQKIRQVDVKPYPGGTAIINFDQPIEILIVQNSEADFEMLCNLLKDQDRMRPRQAKDISEALERMQQDTVDIVILEYHLSDGNGLDFLAEMESLGIEKPVITVTGDGDEIIASRMIKAGALDYLPKNGLDPSTLSNSIATCLETFRLKTEIARAAEKIAQMAIRDELTGLYNRRHMNDVLTREFNRAKRFETDLACLLMDLDFFKEVNDNCGHAFGDFVLHEFGERLVGNVRESDTCFRYGGEEFMVLLAQTSSEGAKKVGERIRRLCESAAYNNGEHDRTVTVSVGVTSLKQKDLSRPEDMLAYADKALYRAKAEGRNRLEVYLEPSAERAKWANGSPDLKFLKDRLAAILDKTKKASIETLELLVNDMGNAGSKDHNHRVVQYLELIGSRLALPQSIIRTLQRAAALHDCTKVLLSQTVANQNRLLNDDEMAPIKDHPHILAELFEPFDFFSKERAALLYHHEKFDGTGYPEGLKGDQIPLGARVFAIADAIVAMTSDRPYRPKLSGEQLVQELVDNAGTQFDPSLVSVFIDILSENNLIEVPAEALSAAREKMLISF
jgi:diguanylate cyclase (GGDEF)-like protein